MDDDAATAFPYPPDDPDLVGVIAAAATAGAQLAEPAHLLRVARTLAQPGWDSRDGDAAVAELARLAALVDDAGAAMQTAVAALLGYQRAILTARTEIRALRRCYAAAVAGHDTAAIGVLHARRRWVDVDLATAAAGTAAALRETLGRLGIARPVGITPATVRDLATARLPGWAAETARAAALRAVRRLDPDRHPPLRPEQRAAVMSSYRDRADEPVFAAALLAGLGPERVRTLLADDVPGVYDDRERPTLDRVFGFLGSVLAAGTLDPAALPAGWLGRLVADAGRPDEHALRMGFGLALRHGRFGSALLDAVVPAVLAAGADHGYSLQQPRDDPAAGVLRALATNAAAARALLDRPGIVAGLLARPWPDDDGAALGDALAVTYAPRDDAAVRIVEAAVAAVGAAGESTPLGISPGLGLLLGRFVDDVNQGLVDRRGDPAVEIDEAPPRLTDGPHPQFDRTALARALVVAMHTERGTATLFAHQTGYARELLSDARATTAVLRPVAKNYGRLSALHQMALDDSARRAGVDEQARLRNREVWVLLAKIAVGMIPFPHAGVVVGVARGLTISHLADGLLQRYYTRPVAQYAAARLAASAAAGGAEERASKLLVQHLGGQRAAGTAAGRDSGPGAVSDAFQAGQRDAEEYLVPR